MEKPDFLDTLAKISGLLDVIDDSLEQILYAQFGFTDKEWLEAIQQLEGGYAAVRKYVHKNVEVEA